jgi:hypothetical protein
VVRREEPRPPVATQVFRLTELGEGLRTAVEALAVWGGEQVPAAGGDGDFRSRWLIIPIEAMLLDGAPTAPEMIMEVVTGDEPVIIEIGAGEVRARTGSKRRAGSRGHRSAQGHSRGPVGQAAAAGGRALRRTPRGRPRCAQSSGVGCIVSAGDQEE